MREIINKVTEFVTENKGVSMRIVEQFDHLIVIELTTNDKHGFNKKIEASLKTNEDVIIFTNKFSKLFLNK